MFTTALGRGLDAGRLRGWLAITFVALALPTAALIWQAYNQLQFESWYRYRNEAQVLAERIDLALGQRIALAEARTFDDFTFAGAGAMRPSPLAAFPGPEDLPGVIGYFQVDPEGRFSSPLVPDDPAALNGAGIAGTEWRQRRDAAAAVRRVLAANALVQPIPGAPRREQATAGETPDRAAGPGAENEAAGTAYDAPAASAPASSARYRLDNDVEPTSAEQQAFDRLTVPAPSDAGSGREAGTLPVPRQAASRTPGIGKLRELSLDDELEQKSEALDRRRDEHLAESAAVAERPAPAGTPEPAITTDATTEGGPETDASRLIRTFETEIEPYRFSPLDGSHAVLYRSAWRDGKRYVQGLLVDQAHFSRDVFESVFRASALAGISSLVVGFDDDVISLVRGRGDAGSATGVASLGGALLYRTRLSPPFERLELVLSADRLPPGPGAVALGWTALVIAVVFGAGFLALYRLGLGQLRLARQQQDFVSAVSHELKTPLTSIRMYGEMLREGWVDADRKKQYYEFIHDESERLTRLISNVLHLARITRGAPQIDLQQVSVDALVDLIRSKIAGHVERAGFEFDIDLDDAVRGRTLLLDDDCFSQIVINLADNAIKFSRDAVRKRIELRVKPGTGETVVIALRDYGPGIPRDQLKKIFRMFYRTESELTRETVGTGIGLAIVHQLTRAMGGSVDAVNRDPGAEFRLSFPSGS